jgi:transcriptional regulator with XRE-family HTH domain
MNKTQKKLNKLSRGKASKWGRDADFRLINRKWLKYSSNIARRLLAGIEDTENMNQKILADKVGVSAQYINKVLKGGENLTLETIGKLSDAIGQELISFPPYKYSIPINHGSQANTIMNWGNPHFIGILIVSTLKESVDSNMPYPIGRESWSPLFDAISKEPTSTVTINSKLLPTKIESNG